MKMELAISQAVAWARTIETAFHHSGPWAFRTAQGTTPAFRLIDTVGKEIVFMGIAPPSTDGMVELWAGDQMVSVAYFDLTQGDKITWRLLLREHERAS